jgi:hypothetical protein
MGRRFASLLLVLSLSAASVADVVATKSGREIEGVVLQENDTSVVVQLKSGTLSYPRDQIASIKRTPAEAPKATETRKAGPFPAWDTIIQSLAAKPWASDLKQIPATVVDKGVMRRVPYQSYRFGKDYELNIYGDPAKPAAVEMGVYRGLLRDDKAKSACVEFVASLLGDADATTLRHLDRVKDSVVQGHLSLEITPETDEDAYGGWWVSVYDEAALDKARASDEEMKEITATPSPAPAPSAVVTPAPVAAPIQSEPRPVVPMPRLDSASTAPDLSWKPSDYTYARPSSSVSSGGGGAVYVRGYTRKDGTYVRPHTRSSPRR